MCIIMRDIYYVIASCATFEQLSNWVGVQKTLNVKQKIFLIEFVEVPLEFNIIF